MSGFGACRKRKAQDEEEEVEKKKQQQEWTKNFEVNIWHLSGYFVGEVHSSGASYDDNNNNNIYYWLERRYTALSAAQRRFTNSILT